MHAMCHAQWLVLTVLTEMNKTKLANDCCPSNVYRRPCCTARLKSLHCVESPRQHIRSSKTPNESMQIGVVKASMHTCILCAWKFADYKEIKVMAAHVVCAPLCKF